MDDKNKSCSADDLYSVVQLLVNETRVNHRILIVAVAAIALGKELLEMVVKLGGA